MGEAAKAHQAMDELIGAIRATPTQTGEFRVPKRDLLRLLENCRQWMVDPAPQEPRPKFVAYSAQPKGRAEP